jgi:hypothetical protein
MSVNKRRLSQLVESILPFSAKRRRLSQLVESILPFSAKRRDRQRPGRQQEDNCITPRSFGPACPARSRSPTNSISPGLSRLSVHLASHLPHHPDHSVRPSLLKTSFRCWQCILSTLTVLSHKKYIMTRPDYSSAPSYMSVHPSTRNDVC